MRTRIVTFYWNDEEATVGINPDFWRLSWVAQRDAVQDILLMTEEFYNHVMVKTAKKTKKEKVKQ